MSGRADELAENASTLYIDRLEQSHLVCGNLRMESIAVIFLQNAHIIYKVKIP